jgi:hypothetical protein
MASDRIMHRVMMMLVQRRQSWRLRIPHLILLLLSTLGSCHYGICASLVSWMVQECANIVNE